MTREQQLEKALKECIEEFKTTCEFLAGQGYSNLAKQILNFDIPKWEAVLKND